MEVWLMFFKLLLFGAVLVIIGMALLFLVFGRLFKSIGDTAIKIVKNTEENIFGEEKKDE